MTSPPQRGEVGASQDRWVRRALTVCVSTSSLDFWVGGDAFHGHLGAPGCPGCRPFPASPGWGGGAPGCGVPGGAGALRDLWGRRGSAGSWWAQGVLEDRWGSVGSWWARGPRGIPGALEAPEDRSPARATQAKLGRGGSPGNLERPGAPRRHLRRAQNRARELKR
jgi:hypothetical protein